jgi:hypothetical protein
MSKVLRLFLLLVSFACSAAYAGESREAFLDALKQVSVIDDAEFKGEALVIWPKPSQQDLLDLEQFSQTLCDEALSHQALVVWFMDSLAFRSSGDMKLLFSQICLPSQATASIR